MNPSYWALSLGFRTNPTLSQIPRFCHEKWAASPLPGDCLVAEWEDSEKGIRESAVPLAIQGSQDPGARLPNHFALTLGLIIAQGVALTLN